MDMDFVNGTFPANGNLASATIRTAGSSRNQTYFLPRLLIFFGVVVLC